MSGSRGNYRRKLWHPNGLERSDGLGCQYTSAIGEELVEAAVANL